MNEHNSWLRVKSSTTSFAKLIGKGLIEGIGPRKVIYAGISTLVEHATTFFKDRSEERLHRFHKWLLDRTDEGNISDLYLKEFDEEDYYQLLKSVVNDDETEKVEIYARIFNFIKIGLIPGKFRRYMIRLTKALTIDDLEVMRKIYVSGNFEFIDDGDFVSQISKITTSNDSMTQISIRTLVQQGLLLDTKTVGPILPSEIFGKVAQWFFDQDVLTPQSIGKNHKGIVDVVLISEKSEMENQNFKDLISFLNSKGLSFVASTIGKFSLTIEKAKCLVLVFGKTPTSEMLNYFSKMKSSRIPIISVQLVSGGGAVISNSIRNSMQISHEDDYIVLYDDIQNKLKAK